MSSFPAVCEGHHAGHQVQALQAGQQGQRPTPHERELSQAHQGRETERTIS